MSVSLIPLERAYSRLLPLGIQSSGILALGRGLGEDSLESSVVYGSGSGSGMLSFGLSETKPFAFSKSLILLDLGLPPLAPFSRFF